VIRQLRTSLGHALIVLGMLLGFIGIGGYSLLREEGYVAALIVFLANAHLACGSLLLALPEDHEPRVNLAALSLSALGFLGLLLYSALQLADASSSAATLQLLACFMCGVSTFVILRDMMYGDW
jgi:hypothetical protein